MQLSAAEWVWAEMNKPEPVLHPNWDARLEQLDRIDEEGCGAFFAAAQFPNKED